MFSWGILFLTTIIVVISFGFGVLSGAAAWAAIVALIIAILLFVRNVILGRRR